MTYTEAINIRLRAAQRQYVSAEELAEAHQVVAATRARNQEQAELRPIFVHPSQPLPFLPALATSTTEPSRCAQRCELLGICQHWTPCHLRTQP